MLDHFVTKYITEDNLNWFFDKHLKDHYNRRKEILTQISKQHDIKNELVLAIEFVLKTCIGPEAYYPPETTSLWLEYYHKLGAGYSNVFKQLLLIYLQLDLATYLTIRKRESTTGRQTRAKDKAELDLLQTTLDKLITIPKCLDFKQSIVKLSTGLWALDNEQMTLMIECLSSPSLNLINYFESTKDIVQLIVGTLHYTGNSREALYMSRVHRPEGWTDEYDQLHAYLLLHSGQLVEALKYERMFVDQDDYQDILKRFFELCSSLDLTSRLNCLNLSIEEEEVWNNLPQEDSRPVTPATSLMGGSNTKNNNNTIISQNQTISRQLTFSTPVNPRHRQSQVMNHTTNNTLNYENSSARRSTSKHTPRNRTVQALRESSFSDSPAKNTRSARKKKSGQ